MFSGIDLKTFKKEFKSEKRTTCDKNFKKRYRQYAAECICLSFLSPGKIEEHNIKSLQFSLIKSVYFRKRNNFC